MLFKESFSVIIFFWVIKKNLWLMILWSHDCPFLWSWSFFLFLITNFLILWSSNLKFDDRWIKKPWSHDYDPRNGMISWSWSHENRDLKFLDHGYSWSRGHDPSFSMIFTFWGFSQWSLNSEFLQVLVFSIYFFFSRFYFLLYTFYILLLSNINSCVSFQCLVFTVLCVLCTG